LFLSPPEVPKNNFPDTNLPVLKYLRIAVTALSLTVCVLLIALWVRSYSRLETISFRGRGANSVSIIRGSLFINAAGFTFIVDDDVAIGITSSSNRRRRVGGRIFISSMHPISHFKDIVPRVKGWKFPIWLLVAASVVVAALPWLTWWSTRFSLRTLLIATTLVAVVMGVIVLSS
jgi:hypothetical protein